MARESVAPIIHLNNLPGGTKTFELVVKFCYGWKVDLKAANVAPLYCVAHFLAMSGDLEQGNLMSKTEAFLRFSIHTSWKFKRRFGFSKAVKPFLHGPKSYCLEGLHRSKSTYFWQ